MEEARTAEEGPCRWEASFLTTLRLALGRTLKKLWEEEGTMAKWEASSWAKKRKAHALKATATDFDRFQARRLRQSSASRPRTHTHRQHRSYTPPSPAAVPFRVRAAPSSIDLMCPVPIARQVMVARKERAAKRAAAMK